MTHDCMRHGITILFATLDVLTGKAIGNRYQKQRVRTAAVPPSVAVNVDKLAGLRSEPAIVGHEAEGAGEA